MSPVDCSARKARSTAGIHAVVLAVGVIILLSTGVRTWAIPRPIGSVRVSFLTGFPDFLSASASLTTLAPLEVEAGLSPWLGYFIRAGFGVPIGNTGDPSGQGWTQHFSVLGGYRYLELFLLDAGTANFHGPNLVLQYRAIRWYRAHLGLELQATLGAWMYREQSYGGIDSDVSWLPDGRVTIGIAF